MSALLRDCFTATVVRVCSSAAATGKTHFEAMAFARSCIDRFVGDGLLPTGMMDCLQCTTLGHPMKLVEPTAAAHAAVTPLTLQARLHTVSMMEPQGCTWAYEQLDRHQMSTTKEIYGELHHDWDDGKASVMMQQMQATAQFENISVDFTVALEDKIIITPGPDSNDQLERVCSQYVRFLRRSGETGLSCHFVNSPPYRPNPIPQHLKSMLQYTPDVQGGIARWSVTSARATNGISLRERGEGSGQTFLATALAGTGRFRPPPASG